MATSPSPESPSFRGVFRDVLARIVDGAPGSVLPPWPAAAATLCSRHAEALCPPTDGLVKLEYMSDRQFKGSFKGEMIYLERSRSGSRDWYAEAGQPGEMLYAGYLPDSGLFLMCFALEELLRRSGLWARPPLHASFSESGDEAEEHQAYSDELRWVAEHTAASPPHFVVDHPAAPGRPSVAIPDGVYDNLVTKTRERYTDGRMVWAAAATAPFIDGSGTWHPEKRVPAHSNWIHPWGTYPDRPRGDDPAPVLTTCPTCGEVTQRSFMGEAVPDRLWAACMHCGAEHVYDLGEN